MATVSNVFHTIDTFASGAAAMWVFMVFVWPRVKTRVVAYLATEAAKLTPKP